VASQYGIEQRYSEYHDMLNDASVDVIDICLPTYLHYRTAMDAFSAGKDVILEKPIAMNLQEADEMIAEAERLNRRFFVSLNQRFIPAHQKIKEILESGGIGRPFLVVAQVIGDDLARMSLADSWKGTWDKAGGGGFGDSGVHLMDLFHYWFGEPEFVTVVANRYLVPGEHKSDDNSAAIFEYPGGPLVNLVVTYSAVADPWIERKDFYSVDASLHMDNTANEPLWRISGKSPTPEFIPVEHYPGSAYGDWWVYSISKSLTHFIDCIQTGVQPLVTPQDARQTLKVTLLGYESAKTGCKVRIGKEDNHE
jgi:predicted dehydrogenase